MMIGRALPGRDLRLHHRQLLTESMLLRGERALMRIEGRPVHPAVQVKLHEAAPLSTYAGDSLRELGRAGSRLNLLLLDAEAGGLCRRA